MGLDLTGSNLLWVLVLFTAGLVCIIKGGDFFVDAAAWMAEASGIPKFIIGCTVVSFATTLPEMLVSVFAALEGNADIAVGNAVGSVTANTGLILCLSLVCMTCAMQRKQFGVKACLLLAAVLALFAFTRDSKLSVLESALILLIFAVSLTESLLSARREQGSELSESEERPEVNKKTIALNIGKFILGAAAIVLGAQLLIDNGSALAGMVGVPDAVIAATMIAVGTSLPELVTTITAIRKKQSTLSVGNIIGANIMDLTVILPLCTLIQGRPLNVENQGMLLDIPACLIISAAVLIPALISGRFKRWTGFLAGGLSSPTSWSCSCSSARNGEKRLFPDGRIRKQSFLVFRGKIRCNGDWVFRAARSGR